MQSVGACEISFLPLTSFSLLPLRRLGPAAPLTAKGGPVVSFVFLLLARDAPFFLERYDSPLMRSAQTTSPSPSQPLAASRSASATAAATTSPTPPSSSRTMQGSAAGRGGISNWIMWQRIRE